MRLLSLEGVESIPAEGAWFDPALHEAVSTASHLDAGVEPQQVVKVTERGYRIVSNFARCCWDNGPWRPKQTDAGKPPMMPVALQQMENDVCDMIR
jgi:hypothetical protein